MIRVSKLRHFVQTTAMPRGARTASTTAMHPRPESDSSSGNRSSSISKISAPMPPPILKKTRGPSSTGPRPTARFISPHESEDDVTGISSSTSQGACVIVRPPTPDAQTSKDTKKGELSPGPRRKVRGFVATNAGHKRRPGIARRHNSDLNSETQETLQTAAAKREDSAKRSSEGSGELISSQNSQYPSKFKENFTPSPESGMALKPSRKAWPLKNGQSKTSLAPNSLPGTEVGQEQSRGVHTSAMDDEAGPSGTSHSSQRRGAEVSRRQRLEETKGLGKQESTSRNNAMCDPPRKETRGKPNTEGSQQTLAILASEGMHKDGYKTTIPKQPARQFLKAVETKSTISMAPQYTAATGEVDFRDDAVADGQGASDAGKSKGAQSERQEHQSLFAKQPIQPVRAASALFSRPAQPSGNSVSRSKSQLTLLLEKDRAKTNEKKKNSAPTSDVPKVKDGGRRRDAT